MGVPTGPHPTARRTIRRLLRTGRGTESRSSSAAPNGGATRSDHSRERTCLIRRPNPSLREGQVHRRQPSGAGAPKVEESRFAPDRPGPRMHRARTLLSAASVPAVAWMAHVFARGPAAPVAHAESGAAPAATAAGTRAAHPYPVVPASSGGAEDSVRALVPGEYHEIDVKGRFGRLDHHLIYSSLWGPKVRSESTTTARSASPLPAHGVVTQPPPQPLTPHTLEMMHPCSVCKRTALSSTRLVGTCGPPSSSGPRCAGTRVLSTAGCSRQRLVRVDGWEGWSLLRWTQGPRQWGLPWSEGSARRTTDARSHSDSPDPLLRLADDSFGALFLSAGVGSGFTANLTIDYRKPVKPDELYLVKVRVVAPSTGREENRSCAIASVLVAPLVEHRPTSTTSTGVRCSSTGALCTRRRATSAPRPARSSSSHGTKLRSSDRSTSHKTHLWTAEDRKTAQRGGGSASDLREWASRRWEIQSKEGLCSVRDPLVSRRREGLRPM